MRRLVRVVWRVLVAGAMSVLVTGCPLPRGAGGGWTPVDVVRPAKPVAAVALVAGEVGTYAADADAVYWSDGEVLWRRRWKGGPVALGSLPVPVAAMAVRGDQVLVLGGRALVAMPVAGGEARTLATGLPAWTAAIVDGDGAWLGTDAGVVQVRGGAAAPLASGLAPVVAMASDREAIYVATGAADASATASAYAHAIVRIAKGGGVPQVLVAEVPGVIALAIRGDRLLWSRARGPAIESVPRRGGVARIELGGTAAAALVADARGAVIMTPTGALAELSPRSGRRWLAPGLPRAYAVPADQQVRLAPGGSTHRLAGTGTIALAGDGVVVPMQDRLTGAIGLWRVSRPAAMADAARVAGWPPRVAWPAPPDLPRIGGERFIVVGGAQIVRVSDLGEQRPLGGADAEATLLRLMVSEERRPRLVALVLRGANALIETIDLSTGARRVRWILPAPSEALANATTAGDAAVSTFLDDSGWLIAVPVPR